MESTTSASHQVLSSIEGIVSRLTILVSELNDAGLNTVPYEGSWTAGQLIRHITKSTNGMLRSIKKPSAVAERDPTERIPVLKKEFLDFSTKMKSPDAIVPENGHYDKRAILHELKQTFREFLSTAQNVNGNELVKGLPLGEITKIELLYFVLYHTQRHLQQLERIIAAIKN